VSESNDYRYDLGDGPRDRSLRVGDKERDSVAEILRQRHLEGRLDSDEFQARLESCLSAKTYAELDELIADFPREAEARNRLRPTRARRPWPLAFVLLPLAVIALVASHGHAVWLAVPLFLFFVVRPLVSRGFGGYGRGPWACGPRRPTRA
jgi:nitrate reductase NapE component